MHLGRYQRDGVCYEETGGKECVRSWKPSRRTDRLYINPVWKLGLIPSTYFWDPETGKSQLPSVEELNALRDSKRQKLRAKLHVEKVVWELFRCVMVK